MIEEMKLPVEGEGFSPINLITEMAIKLNKIISQCNDNQKRIIQLLNAHEIILQKFEEVMKK